MRRATRTQTVIRTMVVPGVGRFLLPLERHMPQHTRKPWHACRCRWTSASQRLLGRLGTAQARRASSWWWRRAWKFGCPWQVGFGVPCLTRMIGNSATSACS